MRFARTLLASIVLGLTAFFAPLTSLLRSDSGQLLLINPRGRKRRRMSAKQRRYFGGGRRRRNPARRHARRRYSRNPQLLLNPGRRIRRRSRGYRRNPIAAMLGGSGGGVASFFAHPSVRGVVDVAKGAATGAAGAIAVDLLMGQTVRYLPTSMQAPNVYPLVKGGAAVLFGLAARRFLGPVGVKMAEGSLICTARDWMRSFVPASLTLGRYVNVGGMGYVQPGYLPPVPNAQNLMGLGDDFSGGDALAGMSGNDVSEMAGTGMYVGTGPG